MFNAILIGLVCLQLSACAKNSRDEVRNLDTMEQTDSAKLKITIGSNIYTASLYTNPTAIAFKNRLPLTVSMADLNGNEKYSDLGNALPPAAGKPGTIHTGDLMLYGTNTLVLFYKTFSSSYTYSAIGQIDDPLELSRSMGNGNVIIKYELIK